MPRMKKTAVQARTTRALNKIWLKGVLFVPCISMRTIQPCGMVSETVLIVGFVLPANPRKMGIAPIQVVIVNTPPKTAPPCLVLFKSELMKIPKADALRMIQTDIRVIACQLPQLTLKIRRAAMSRIITCAVTVSRTPRNFPVKMEGGEVGVVNKRCRV